MCIGNLGNVCPKCGKEFFPTALHAYKDGDTLYCSWSCLNRRFDEDGEHRQIEMLNFDGRVMNTFNSIAEAIYYVGGKPELLIRALKTETAYKRFRWRYKKT